MKKENNQEKAVMAKFVPQTMSEASMVGIGRRKVLRDLGREGFKVAGCFIWR